MGDRGSLRVGGLRLRGLRGLRGRVGGRFHSAALAWKQRHPIALPRRDSWAERLAVVKRTLMGLETEDVGVGRFHTLPAMAAGIIDRRPIACSEWLIEKEPLEVASLVLLTDCSLRVLLRLSNGQHLEREIRKVVLLERDGEKDGVKVQGDMVRVVTDIV